MNLRRILIFFLVIFLLSIISIFYHHSPTGQVTNTKAEYTKEEATLLRVIDGDTIEIDEGPHVRLLGINNIEV